MYTKFRDHNEIKGRGLRWTNLAKFGIMFIIMHVNERTSHNRDTILYFICTLIFVNFLYKKNFFLRRIKLGHLPALIV